MWELLRSIVAMDACSCGKQANNDIHRYVAMVMLLPRKHCFYGNAVAIDVCRLLYLNHRLTVIVVVDTIHTCSKSTVVMEARHCGSTISTEMLLCPGSQRCIRLMIFIG